MRSVIKMHPAAGLVLAGALALGAGCAERSEPDILASAARYLEQKNVQAATVELKAALQKNPDSFEARLMLGKALQRAGDIPSAVVELGKARDLGKDHDRVLPLLARAQLAGGNAKTVSDTYARVKLTSPKATADLKAVVAQAYWAQGDADRTREMVDAALQLDADNADARVLRARLMARQGAFDPALEIVNAVLAADAQFAPAWIAKAELLAVGKSDFDGGIQALRQALAIDARQMGAHVALIQLLLHQKDFAGWKTQIAALQKAFPKSFEARFYAVEVALVDGDAAKARDGAQKLLRDSPSGYAPTLQLAGAAELKGGSPVLAQKYLTQAVRLAPNVPLARQLLAQSHLRTGDAAKAIEIVQPLLDGNPNAEVLAIAAEANLQSGKAAEAEKLYAQAATADPKSIRARVALAVMQAAKGQRAPAMAELEALAAADPTTYADMVLVGMALSAADAPAGLKAIDGLERKMPGQPLPQLIRGRVLLMKGDRAGARASFDKALVANPSYFPAIADLAAVDVAEKKFDDARKRFQDLLAREPQNYRARIALAELLQRSGGKDAEVEALLVEAVKTSPTEPAARLALVEHHLAMRRNTAALAAAWEAAAASPENDVLQDALGRAQLAAGQTPTAIATFQKIASRSKSAAAYVRLAEVHILSKDHAAAADSLGKALEISPRLIEAQRGLIAVEVARKRVDSALRVAKDVQKQRPSEAIGFAMEGDIQLGQRAWGPAIAAFQAALQREPSTATAKRLHAIYGLAGRPADGDRFAAAWERAHPKDADFVFHLGLTAMDRKDDKVAEALFRQVLELQPDSVKALNNLAWLLVRQGKAGAVEYAERANRLAPDQPFVLDTLATALVADKRLPEAVEWQKKAVEKAPDAPGYRFNLAKLLVAAGDRAAARAELQKLAALGGRFAGQAEVAVMLKNLSG